MNNSGGDQVGMALYRLSLVPQPVDTLRCLAFSHNIRHKTLPYLLILRKHTESRGLTGARRASILLRGFIRHIKSIRKEVAPCSVRSLWFKWITPRRV
jgi:hypothetical protein